LVFIGSRLIKQIWRVRTLPNIYARKTGVRNEWDYKGEIKQYLLSNVILKMFFMQIGILLIPTIVSMCNFLLTDMGTMPSTLRMIDKLTGIVWWIYYIYFAFYAITMIYYSITAGLKKY